MGFWFKIYLYDLVKKGSEQEDGCSEPAILLGLFINFARQIH